MQLVTWLFGLILGIAQAAQPAPPAAAAKRFDMLVRADFFAGFAGDEARLKKAMEFCERALAENPKDAEAMVWHGSGVFYMSGQAFQSGDVARAGDLWQKGLDEMNAAVALAPDNVAVLIPRGATLIQATRTMSAEMARPLLASGVRNYEHVLALQTAYFDTLGDHAKGELLFGLAEGYSRLGQPDTAREYFNRLVKDAPTSGHAPQAQQWIESGSIGKVTGAGCVGCHK